MMTLTSAATDFFHVPVAARTADGRPVDPSADPVAFAFLPEALTPGPADWHPGVWEPSGPDGWVAKILIGPGALALPAGPYVAWCKVTDNPTVPVAKVGFLSIT